MGFRKRIADRIWKEPPKVESLVPETPSKIGKAVISTYEYAGKSPTSTFAAQVKVFKKDAVIREAIVHSAMEILGTGLFTSMNEKYGLVLQGKTAKEKIDWWNEKNNLDEVILSVALELLSYGNSFWMLTSSGLQPIPIEAISRAVPNTKGVSISQSYDLELTGGYTPNVVKWGTFVHFRVNVTSSSSPLGTGLIAGLIESYGEDANGDEIPSLLDVRNTIRTALAAGFAKFANPTEIFSFPDLGDDALGDGVTIGAVGGVAKQVKDMPPSGSRLTVNTTAKIESSQTRRDTGWEAFINNMADETIMALGTPWLKASVESGFTEASIKGSIQLFHKKILAFRRAIKRVAESLWRTVLSQAGFSPDEAQMKLNFGAEEIEWVITDLISAVEKGIISKEEARQVLMKKARWELTGSAPKTPEGATPQ